MTTYYVGPGGNNANAGTSWALRKLTLNGAEDIPVVAGDTVYVGPGTYRETLTCDVSGTSGSPITYIGDYTGANTDGTGGVVRITGSDNDTTATRNYGFDGSSSAKNYRTFTGFALDLTSSYSIINTGGTNWIIEDCHSSCNYGFQIGGAASTCTVRRCMMRGHAAAGANALNFVSSGAGDQSNTAHVVENCVIIGGSASSNGVSSTDIGGITVRNCLIIGANRAVNVSSLAGGQVVTVNNCILYSCTSGLYSDAASQITEDYNTVFGCATARTNTSTGGNSNTYPWLPDPRAWFEATLAGGTLVTPFDLASYSKLVELNSGTGAPAADLRGTTVQGTYREWGALEYDSTLAIEAGAGAGGGMGGIFGSIVR